MRSFFSFILAAIVVGPLLFLLQGWSISTLWNWFIAPLGAPEIGIATALGISLTAGVLRFKGTRNDDNVSRKERLERVVGYFLVPVIAVGIGWVVLQFA